MAEENLWREAEGAGEGSSSSFLSAPTPARPQLAKLSPTHEMMINWLIMNTDKSLRECADHFGYTQSWVSSVIHCDLFQQALKERQLDVAARVAGSIPEKLRRAADIAIDKLTTKLEEVEDHEFILDATDKILHRMGYAPASTRNPGGSPGQQPVNQQNNFFVSAGDLADARGLMQASAEAARATLQPQGGVGARHGGALYDENGMELP